MAILYDAVDAMNIGLHEEARGRLQTLMMEHAPNTGDH